jgi:outer membrane protein assembly factor BamB
MNNSPKISSIVPERAIPGGQVEIYTEQFRPEPGRPLACYANGLESQIVGSSAKRTIAMLPDSNDSTVVVQLDTSAGESNGYVVTMGKILANEMHIVTNPAIDPSDDALVLTRSGSRGQQLAHTLYRLETDGYLDELPVEVMNPTGVAFGPSGKMYVTNRADGTVYRIERGEEAVAIATGIGVATGIAFNSDGEMFVGDRSGTIYRVYESGSFDRLATLEPSVAAYHMAFGPDGRLYVSSPGFWSHDAIYAVDPDGGVEHYVRGLGRPQGLAFDRDGHLYAAACYRGRHGIVKIHADSREIEHFVAGGNVVGLCFTRNGEMVVATSDAVFSLNLGIFGTLLT